MTDKNKHGQVVKIAGPLVVATGLPHAKIYEVVYVSDERLVGEVIELRGENVFIQVYEETDNIGPGAPVYATGAPLEVELGPGLLNSIYDGIQRPLDAIAAKAGVFITRGISVPSLNREKKWAVKAVKAVGDKVVAGDILALVPETGLIEHRIMVPFLIKSGRLESINSGDLKVEDVLAVIKDDLGQVHQVKLMTRWPIRNPRPVATKVIPNRPLATGQRVIDTLFPVAKGGTASIPGPFGAGKCVVGDTPVLLGRGNHLSIKKLWQENERLLGAQRTGPDEEVVALREPLQIYSFLNGQFKLNEANLLYRGRTNALTTIKTRSGREYQITPIHKLLTINRSLEFKERAAQEFKPGDYIVTPRRLDFTPVATRFNAYELLPDLRVADEKILKSVPRVITALSSKFGSKKALATKLGVSPAALMNYYLRRTRPTLAFIERLYSLAGLNLPLLRQIKGEHQSRAVDIPEKMTREFAEFCGLMLGDGMIKKGSLRFYNNDSNLRARFIKITRLVFGLKKYTQTITNSVQTIVFESVPVAKLMFQLGYPEYHKSLNCGVPQSIISGTKEVVARFLGAYFLCDGYNGGKELEFATSSPQMASDIGYLLTRLGIVYRYRKEIVDEKQRFRVTISDRTFVTLFWELCAYGNFRKFNDTKAYLEQKVCGYTAIDIVPIGKSMVEALYAKSGRPYQMLKKSGIEITNYTRNGELMSRRVFQKFVQILGLESMAKFAFNDLEHTYFDKVVSVATRPADEYVYDLQVPQGHNFVGGTVPMIYHNTVVQQQLSKWADADVIIYVGCGERGNEMTDVLEEFPHLKDPKTGLPLMERTILVANTSNMPVAAREASIYTGITLAEYYRDMGYNVALMADSTSRWAEALREISARLEEMPGEEGYPAYLGSKVAAFYERAGAVKTLGQESREATLTVVGAVSPPGGDLSEPVTQSTLRVTKVFWALDDKLANRRHFPAINWLESYSRYTDEIKDYLSETVGADFLVMRTKAVQILQREAALSEIVRLVGVEALSAEEQIVLETAKSLREDFLHQNAFDEIDTYTSLKKQRLMLKVMLAFHEAALKSAKSGKTVAEIRAAPVRSEIAKTKFVPEDNLALLEKLIERINKEV